MIDVIIPVYNTPIKDLNRCLNSILKQDYKKYKVYIIDDGSKESISMYLDNFVKGKERFTVKHISNCGASSARNVGIKLSKSEYVTFIDSDDTITEHFFKEAVSLIEENNLDVIVGGYNEIADSYVYKIRKCKSGLHIYDGKDTIKYFDKLLSSKLSQDNLEIASTPTGRIYTKLYKREVFKNILFNKNIKISEDTLFLIDIMKNIKSIGVTSDIWYNYYQNYYSIIHKKTTDCSINNLLDFINEVYTRMLKEKNKRIKNAYKYRIFKASCDLYDLLNKNNIIDPKEIFSMNLFRTTFSDLDISKYIDVSDKEKIYLNKLLKYIEN